MQKDNYSIEKLLVEPIFVRPNVHIDTLFEEFKRKRTHMAIVQDKEENKEREKTMAKNNKNTSNMNDKTNTTQNKTENKTNNSQNKADNKTNNNNCK